MKSTPAIGYVCIIITTGVFSFIEIVLKTMDGAFNPVQLTFLRFLVGAVALTPFMIMTLRKNEQKVRTRDLGLWAALAFVGIAFSMLLYQIAILFVDASAVAVLFSTNSVFTLFAAALMIHEPIYKRNVIALAFAVIGILFVVNIVDLQVNALGIALILVSSATFAIYGVGSKAPSIKFGALPNACMCFWFGSIELFAFSLFTNIPAVSDFFGSHGLEIFASVPIFNYFPKECIGQFLFAAIGSTGVGYTCYSIAMEKCSPNTVALIFFFKPILASTLSFLILKDAMPVTKIIGIIIMATGSTINLLPPLIKEHQMKKEQLTKGEAKC